MKKYKLPSNDLEKSVKRNFCQEKSEVLIVAMLSLETVYMTFQ